MHLIGWLMVLCCSGSALIGAEVDESSASMPVLSHVMSRLNEAQAQIEKSCASVGVVVPSGLADVLLVRRTIAADWQRRLVDGSVQLQDQALVRFIGDQERFIGSLQQAIEVMQQRNNLAQRFPHCTKEAAFTRYHAFLLDAIHQHLNFVAGRQSAPTEPDWRERESQHLELLTQIESGHIVAERYATLPSDDRQLAEYRELMAQARTALEQNIGNAGSADDQQDYSYQAILDAYKEVLDIRVQTLQEIAKNGLEANAPEVITLHRTTEMFIQVWDKQLAVVRRYAGYPAPVSIGMNEEDEKEIDEQAHVTLLARHEGERVKRLLAMASQWLSSESERLIGIKAYDKKIASAQPNFIQANRKIMNGFSEQQRATQSDFDRAISASDESAALTAQQSLERIRQHRTRHLEKLDEEMDLAERENNWRAHAKNPEVAERLREWDKQRAAALAAEQAITEAEDAALAAKHAVERAEWIANQAEERAHIVQQSAEKYLYLNELMNALDEFVEQSVEPQIAE